MKRYPGWMIGAGAMLVTTALLAVIYFTSGTLFHDSDAFHLAISTAETNPVVIQNVGTPLETGRFVSGKMEVSKAAGHAEFSIPISGPKGHGKLYVEAHKTAGSWRMSVLQFIAEGSQTPVDILASAPMPISPN